MGFVKPETDVLTLADGSTVTVWRRLNTGQARARAELIYNGSAANGELKANLLLVGRATVIVYLVDWTQCDESGTVVPIRGLPPAELGAVLDHLEPRTFGEIRRAIEAHETHHDEKKTDGATSSDPT